MRDELLKAGDINVVVVDWAGGSLPLYTQATANTRLVGLELGYFINYLAVSIILFSINFPFYNAIQLIYAFSYEEKKER